MSNQTDRTNINRSVWFGRFGSFLSEFKILLKVHKNNPIRKSKTIKFKSITQVFVAKKNQIQNFTKEGI